MATRRIHEFLRGNKVSFGVINHRCAYTAQEVAASSHVPGRFLAKSVIVALDGRLAIVAVPATNLVDFDKLRRESAATEVRLANESEFRNMFEGCQLGTEPPVGNLFGLVTYLDRQLAVQDHIAFNAGTHTDVFVMEQADYMRLVQPRIVDVAQPSPNETGSRKSARVRARPGRKQPKTRPPEYGSEVESLVQADCGCPIIHHMGAD